MRKINILLFALAISMMASAQQKLTALMSWASFQQPADPSSTQEGSPYVETYLSFDAWNLQFLKQKDGKYQATVEVAIQVLKGDSAVFTKRYDLQSPAVEKNGSKNFTFMDLQRFALANGEYELCIFLRDKAVKGDPIQVSEKIFVKYPARRPMLSTVQTMADAEPTMKENMLSRNGYDMTPYIDEYYPESVNVINCYFEIYNIQREIFDADFMTLTYLETKETGHRVSGPQSLQRHKGSNLVPVYSSLDISLLPSGNYNLVVEVRNRDNQLMLFKRVPIKRSNPSVAVEKIGNFSASFAGQITDENELNYYLMALYPIASEAEKNFGRQLAREPGKLAEKQEFFYEFWQARNPMDPAGEWRDYKNRLDYVAANFSYPRTPGYMTDRGRVYLQYGAPDFIRDEKNFVSTRNLGSGFAKGIEGLAQQQGNTGHIYYLPYQLWRYNTLFGDQPNRVFIFWDQFRSGYYQLLNSNAKGEVQDPKWERTLSQQQLNEDIRGEVGEQFERGY